MANMSYCRFNNTKLDMEDCLEAINSQEIEGQDELNSAKKMFKQVLNFCEENGVIEEYDVDKLEEILEDAVIR